LITRSASDQARFDLVLVGYRPMDTRKSVAFCDRAFGAKLVRRRILVLNNEALTATASAFTPRWELVGGSNGLAEFSGWQEGLTVRDAAERAPAGVIFVNDSVVTHRHFTSARRLALVGSVSHAPTAALVAFRDQVRGELAVAGFGLDSWASTYCFALTTEALRRLDGRLYDPEIVMRCVPGGLDESRFFADLSPDLNAHLRHWLFDGGWYGGAKLTIDNADRMAQKARCIIAEKFLSARCEAAGIAAVDPFDEHRALHLLDKLQRRIAGVFTR
jgi:hypothetical protein